MTDNYRNLRDDIVNVDQQIGSVGDQDTGISAEFFIEELIQEIK